MIVMENSGVNYSAPSVTRQDHTAVQKDIFLPLPSLALIGSKKCVKAFSTVPAFLAMSTTPGPAGHETPGPEIHIVPAEAVEGKVVAAAAGGGKSGYAKKRKQKGKAKRDASGILSAEDGSRKKRRRAVSEVEVKAAGLKLPVTLLQLQRGAGTTQSFRHLFSFGNSNASAHEAAPQINAEPAEACQLELKASHETASERELGGSATLAAKADPTKKKESEPVFSLFGEPVECAALNPSEIPFPLSPTVAESRLQPAPESSEFLRLAEATRKRPVVDYVAHDGLAGDQDAETMELALSFCGADRTVEELETEWTSGGKREAMREDLRLKRHKRLRGRVLGASTLPHLRT
jgi:hypothetical protein